MSLKILIVDDHELILLATQYMLRHNYPEANIVTAITAREAVEKMASFQPDVAILDIRIPEKQGMLPKNEVGIELIQNFLVKYPTNNFVIQSCFVKSLVRIKNYINVHQGGFVIVDKACSIKDFLTKFNWAVKGLNFTKELRPIVNDIRLEWLKLLKLAFYEGLSDKAIAQHMTVAERTVRYYWTKIHDILDVYPEEGINMRVKTEIRAREEGLID